MLKKRLLKHEWLVKIEAYLLKSRCAIFIDVHLAKKVPQRFLKPAVCKYPTNMNYHEICMLLPKPCPWMWHLMCGAIPWWRLWPKFENFSLLIDHISYNKQAISHFVVDVRSTLGGQSTVTPQKINLGQGQAQCPCNARWRLWLRTKVGSASESLQSPISVKCDRVLCQHLYIWWTTYC